MNIVLDTSSAAAAVFNQKSARAILNVIEESELVIAPELFVSEITNVCSKYHQLDNMPISSCELALKTAIRFVDEYVSVTELYIEAFSLSCISKAPAYDMFFLVLARRNNAELLTVDQKLKSIAKRNQIKLARY